MSRLRAAETCARACITFSSVSCSNFMYCLQVSHKLWQFVVPLLEQYIDIGPSLVLHRA
jgi:hypothetical protein